MRDLASTRRPRRAGAARLRAVAGGIAALVLLILLLVGIPIGLWMFGRDWLPTGVPDLEQVRHALTTRDTGALLLGVATVVGFAAWAVFAMSVVLEFTARLRHRPAPRLRGCGWAQSIAGVLLTAVVTGLLGTSASAATAHTTPFVTVAQPASFVTQLPPDHAVAPATQQATPGTSATAPSAAGSHPGPIETPRTVVVGPRMTLWGLAQQWYDGDGTQYRKILDLNINRTQPDGRTLTADGHIRAGWILLVPADANLPGDGELTQVVVRPGDTLSEIAQGTLGDASQYPLIFAENKGKHQPDGKVLSNPDKIRPGWILTVPSAVSSAPPTPLDEPPQPAPHQLAPTLENPRPPATSATPPPISASQAGPESPAPPHSPPAAATSTTAAPTVPTAPATPTPGAPQPHQPRGPAVAEAEDGDLFGLPIPLAVSAILAAALGSGLVAARRRQQRRRTSGRQVALPSSAAVRVEKAMRTAEHPADVAFLDLALRSLGAVLAESGALDADHVDQALPDVIAAWLGPAGLRLLLRTPSFAAPPPFITNPDGTEWSLPIDAELRVTAATAARHLAPLPTLASVGTYEQDQLLLDLEGLGAVRICGDSTKACALLRHLAAELAHNCWSDGLDVMLVGVGEPLTAINPDRIRYVATLDQALSGLRARLADVRQHLEQSPADSVLHGRVNDLAGDAWMPEVLLVACHAEQSPEHTDRDATPIGSSANPASTGARHAEAELDELLRELIDAGRTVIAVVASGSHTHFSGLTITLSPEGTLRVPSLTEHPLQAEGIPDSLTPLVVELFAAAQAADEPIPPASEPAGWASNMDASGRLMWSDSTEEPETGDDESAEATTSPADSGRLVEFPGRPAAEAEQQLARVHAQDPTLDADLEEWHNDTAARPKISILGDPTVVAPGIAPKQRVQWYTEVLVYLALHPHGVTPDKLTEDLWDGRQVERVTYRQVMSTARKWAGVAADGEFVLTHLRGDEPYKLRDFLLDWTLFRRLRKRAEARAAAGAAHDAIADYRTALNLIRGPAFSGLRPGGYGWLANRDQAHDRHLPGFVAETAHDLVVLTLAEGDTDLATWAAETALRMDIYRTEDRPLLDLMRIAHVRHDHAALETYARRLIEDADVELPEDLPPATFEVFNELLPRGVRRGA